ncbi:MAG: hypothetical protein HY22_10645 [[Candidatus Thermochlorobacteriaceae] bacterium GBChlB]|nr:MAG: hypothetical protein HY22_10645 [[Candidatus Thermochlorobacteriaceae] bacterium GBChlB]
MNLRQTAFCVFICCFFAPTLSAQKPSLNVLDFGAKGDGKTLNTRFLQAAIDSCDKRGGGAIVIPAGKFLTGTLFLKSNLRVHLEAGCELVGSANLADYDSAHKHLLYGAGIANFSLTGQGVIEGNGKAFWDEKYNPLDRPAPWILLEDATDISIRDVKLQNSPAHVVALIGCNRVVVDGITILNDMRSPNTDGIDITSTSNVMISNCFISTGDDAICLKVSDGTRNAALSDDVGGDKGKDKPTENVVVTNCIIESDDAALKLGTGSGTRISHCRFSNCIIRNTRFAVALFMKDGGVFEHIDFSNLTIETRSRYATEYPIYIDVEKREESGRYGKIRHIKFSNLNITTRGNCLIAGQPDAPLEHLTLEGISMHVAQGVDVSTFKKPRGNRKLGDIKGSVDFASIPAHITIGCAQKVAVQGVSIFAENTVVDRHGLCLNKVRDIQIEHFTGRQAKDDGSLPVILLIDSGDCLIRNSTALPNTATFLKADGAFSGRLSLLMNNFLDAKNAWLLPKNFLKNQFLQQANLINK